MYRRKLEALIESLLFRLDTFPSLPYQPVPSLGLTSAGRSTGSFERWDAVKATVDEVEIRSAIDIGSNAGFFCDMLADRGVKVIGLEMQGRFYRLAKRAAATRSSNRPLYIQMELDSDNVAMLPTVDMCLLLSVWHHWVKLSGLKNATDLLGDCWAKAQKMMIFETGENEMTSEYNLPTMEPDAQTWIKRYLEDTCENSKVECLGRFQAFAPGGNESKNVAYRNLYKVVRKSE